MAAMIGGMFGLGHYLTKEYRMIVGEAEKASIKIGPTESGVRLSFHFL